MKIDRNNRVTIIMVILIVSPIICNINIYAINAQSTEVNEDDLNHMTLPQLFEKVERSVVQITDEGETSIGTRLGSGFVFDKDHIITNYHVVAGMTGNPEVTFLDGSTYQAEIVGTDPFTDLAVLRVVDVPKEKLNPLPIGNSSALKVGEKVVAIGNPFGLSGSMTEGIVSGLGRLLPASDPATQSQEFSSFSIPDIIQTDAAINPGNSGGPLINERGEIVGINTAIFSTTGLYSGVGFAVPSNTIKKVIPSLMERGSYEHPYLGVIGLDISPRIANIIGLEEAKGFLVTNVSPNSPAEKAGIQGGDTLVNVNGEDILIGGDIIMGIDNINVRKIDDILTHLGREKKVGDQVVLTVLRGNQIETKTLTLESRPSAIQIQQQEEKIQESIPNVPDQGFNGLYEECIKIAGEGICDFLFQR